MYLLAETPNAMWEIWIKLFLEVLEVIIIRNMHLINIKRLEQEKSLGLRYELYKEAY